MKFPTPPPVRKQLVPKPDLSASPAAQRVVRLAYVVSIVFWVVVMALLGAAAVWLVLWPSIRHVDQALALAAILNACIAFFGYFIGMWSARLILSELVKSARTQSTTASHV
ncbi:MAG: hypothetical protein WA001_05780 [Patescibacteria group bacterium]